MAALPIVLVPVAGGVSLEGSDIAASSGGDTAPVGAGRFLYVRNGGASSRTVTIATPGTVSGLPIADVTVAVPAGESKILPLTSLVRGANGRAALSYDAVTDLTVACFELER
ncbi:hypothetical protein GCM10010497_46070 [Streptomyces cinereoruber]|uniref:Uncharacterized protein n=1 Tax=Streptomyces cinereoruber TaxID=67260 RepID=A0AAV4KQN7_9ACTN|nr:hypothetical protein [Streptomyces cinereoruber]MBB4160076.1 hypothetical protein [Streptomyces cinereoruber]MBY8818313.1 hypothetical protein [Streptomyces cinereoruber]NIH61014.1 hypothetical protein [Streptomyces cinereoruber]QEV33273.1 hypothetical protein CP977_14775 [Streptomyces cinereoruber]GGR37969.1 hypothetical protein GCM10010497_46070 [Streptomyces cinereoruber]